MKLLNTLSLQAQQLRKGVDVVCATPGRLNDHLTRGAMVCGWGMVHTWLAGISLIN